MFRILEIIFSIIFLTGSIFYFKKVKNRSNRFIVYLCAVIMTASMSSGILVESMPIAYESLIEPLRFAVYGIVIIFCLAAALTLHKKMGNKKTIELTCGLLALIGSMMFFMDIRVAERSGYSITRLFIDFFNSFSTQGVNLILPCLLFPMLYKMYLKIYNLYETKYSSIKGTLCIIIPAGFFAGFMVLGSAFDIDDTLNAIFDNEVQLAKAMFLLIGYWAMFFFAIIWTFNFLDNVDLSKKNEKKYNGFVQCYFDCLQKRPFITAFITLWVAYIPYIIVSYPGIYMGDTLRQFRIALGIYPMDNAHPITHTLFIKLCLELGMNLFNSVNAGTFIYALLQMLFVIIVISLTVKIISDKASYKLIVVLLGYYVLFPGVNNYMMLITKDIINAVFMLVFILSVYILVTNKKSLLIYAVLGISDMGAVLFRHEQVYIIVISMILVAFLIKDFRKQAAVIAVGTLVFSLIWSNILLVKILPPANSDDESGGILKSIMIQQTARCVRDRGDQFTDEEKEVVSAVFDCDALVKEYTPRKSVDAAAGTMKSVTSAEWKAYEKTWLKMFFKYPQIYVEAVLNFKYQFFYPYKNGSYDYWWSISQMDVITSEFGMVENGGVLPSELSHPESLSRFRFGYEAFREKFFSLPIINIVYKSSTFMWCLFIWFVYCIYHNDKKSVAVMMPLLVMALVLIAGPTNGWYFRYQYPYALCLPIVIVIGLFEKTSIGVYEATV